MKQNDSALNFSNPHLLACVYFGLLSVVGTILIDALLTMIGVTEIIPLFQAIILGMVVASITGAIFGKWIIYCPRPFMAKTFGLGFLMVILSLPFFDLGFVLFMQESESHLVPLNNLHDFISAFLIVLGYSYILFGFLLAIGAGLASMYLRARLVYDILHTDRRRSQRLPNFVAARKRTKSEQKIRVRPRKKI